MEKDAAEAYQKKKRKGILAYVQADWMAKVPKSWRL